MSARNPLYFYYIARPKDPLVIQHIGIVSPEYHYFNGDTISYLRTIQDHDLMYYHSLQQRQHPNRSIITNFKNQIPNVHQDLGDQNNQIRLLRYVPTSIMGPNMESFLDGSTIYQIDIEDSNVRSNIQSIDWGYWMNNPSTNRVLNRHYYANVFEEPYFQYFKDTDRPLFKSINQIKITLKKNNIISFRLWEEI